jgi:serine phosphatase RsbU (regulator of sigma subunit)/anti-sigma regulatory factor (Ser/Thr protein kinase)
MIAEVGHNTHSGATGVPVSVAELCLGDEPDAVPRARRFVAQLLGDATPHREADAALVVTELVTNAKLYGEPPIRLRVDQQPDRLRIEVHDVGRAMPVQPRPSLDAMTGRGLALVRAVATDWGVQPGPSGGKTVWAEIAMVGRRAEDAAVDWDVDSMLDAWPDSLDPEPRFHVRLGAVPTDLLLAAKSHIDNVVRELTLARDDATAMPRQMAALVNTVTEDFAEARAAIKRQAIAAANRGEVFTDLTLKLPVSAAEAGERYLRALDEADQYAREKKLLTLSAPAAHRAFRRWYVQALVDQLRAAAHGEEPPLPPLFPQVLAEEVNRLADPRPRPAALVADPGYGGDLHDWRLSDAIRVCGRVRACTRDATSMEDAATSVVSFFRTAFVDPTSGGSAFALARLFKTEELRNLPGDLQARGRQAADDVQPTSRFLTLLATSGDEPAWCDRRASRDHQLIPVVSSEAIAQAPMISALVNELGVGVDTVVHGASESQMLRADFDVFHVQDAAGSVDVPGQDFVREHGVRSVIGFGGVLPTGHVFAVVLFSHVRIPAETARLFRTVALSVKLALLPHVTAPVFADHPVLPQRAPISDLAQVRALEEMLDVHERTALEQAAALEERDGALRREAETVETLRHVGEALSSVLDVETVVQLTTTAAADVTRAQFGAFFYNVVDESGESFMLYALAGAPRDAFAPLGMPRNTPVFGPTFRGDGAVRSDDITADPRYGKVAPHYGMPKGHPPVRSYLAAPVISPTSGDVLGGLFFGHEQIGVFDDRAERLVVGIAAQTAIALENASLYHRERQTALQLQQALLPAELPASRHVTTAHRYRPGTEGLHVGGDWYDIIPIGDQRVGLVIGDVMGRGVRAAATMGQLRSSIRAFAALDLAPSTVAEKLNEIIVDLPDEQIATFLYAVFDADTRTLTYTSAGHLPPVIVTAGEVASALSSSHGPPLGIPSATYEQDTICVAAGDAIVLFTDGLVESRARSVDDGMQAVLDVLAGTETSPEQLCDTLLDKVGGAPGEDDVALLYARFR